MAKPKNKTAKNLDTIIKYIDFMNKPYIKVLNLIYYFGTLPDCTYYVFNNVFIISIFIVGILMKFGIIYFLFSLIPFLHLHFFQIKRLNFNSPENCLSKFKSNNFLGLLILTNILIGKFF